MAGARGPAGAGPDGRARGAWVAGSEDRRGFTLVELMLVLVVAGMVLGYAVPSLREVFLRARVTATVNDLLGFVEGGRALAQVGHVPVTVCPVDGDGCGTRWDGALMLFRDLDGDGERDAGDEVLQQAHMLAAPLWLVWKPFRATPYLTWTRNGQATSMNGTFTLCNEARRSDLLRQVVVSRAGRVRLYRPATADAVASAQRACGG